MNIFLQVLITGIAMGFIYALVGIEYTIIWNYYAKKETEEQTIQPRIENSGSRSVSFRKGQHGRTGKKIWAF